MAAKSKPIKSITIDDIYAAINPLPAKLLAKGKANPAVEFEIEANAGFRIATTP